MDIQHPFHPDVDWTIAVSRRFHGQSVVDLYFRVIAPVLAQHGMLLECSDASDDHTSPDYWVDRITTILAVTDIHVLVDLDRSGYVEYEFERSRQQALRGGAPALAAAYSWASGSVGVLRPCRILVTDGKNPSPTRRTPRTTMLRIHDGMTDPALASALHDHLIQAKEARTTWVRKSGKVYAFARRLYFFWPEHSKHFPEPRSVSSDAFRIARALKGGATFATLGAAVAMTTSSSTPVEDNLGQRSASITREIQHWYVEVKTGGVEVPATFRGRYIHVRDRYQDWARRGLGEDALSSRWVRSGIAVVAFLGAASRRFRRTRRSA